VDVNEDVYQIELLRWRCIALLIRVTLARIAHDPRFKA
jgi:hypothetical protein